MEFVFVRSPNILFSETFRHITTKEQSDWESMLVVPKRCRKYVGSTGHNPLGVNHLTHIAQNDLVRALTALLIAGEDVVVVVVVGSNNHSPLTLSQKIKPLGSNVKLLSTYLV